MLVKVEGVGEVEVIEGCFAFTVNEDGTDGVFLEDSEIPKEAPQMVKVITDAAQQLRQLIYAHR